MISRRAALFSFSMLLLGSVPRPAQSAGPVPKLPGGIVPEEQPADSKQVKIVLVAGSNFYKLGEHEYLAGCAALMDLLRQTPGVFPVLAVDWPEKTETLDGARAIVLFFDGGDKHALLDRMRLDRIQKLANAGMGLVQLHQVDDYPIDLGERARQLMGATWEKGYSQRAHWVSTFKDFPDHPIFRGVAPFTIDDGWLFKLRFSPGMKGVTPLLRTSAPKNPVARVIGNEDVVAWAYERPESGRSFTFTGGHLHRSLAEEGYRRFLVNGILWAADVGIPATGAPVALVPADLNKYLADRKRGGGE